MRLSDNLTNLGTETAFAVLARARQLEAEGRSIVHLGIGAPDFDTPEHIKAACDRALRDGHTAYCPAQGLPELRAACAAYLAQTRGVDVDPGRIVVTPGAKPFIAYSVLATCDPGDEVIYPDPGFPIYESAIRFFGATPVPLRLEQASGMAPTAEGIAELVSRRTRLVILNSPGNPTGAVVDAAEMAQIAAVLSETDAWILSDEVYSEMVYDGRHDSPTCHGLLDRTILLDGFSKTFSMTGWRLGYAAVPDPLVEPITRLIVNTVSCTPPAFQLAGVAALEGPRQPVRAMTEEFRARRMVVVDGLNSLPGVTCPTPNGAFYAFPDISGTGLGERDFANRALEEAGVALVAGTSFGEAGAGHVRVSYANSVGQIEEGIDRLRRMLS